MGSIKVWANYTKVVSTFQDNLERDYKKKWLRLSPQFEQYIQRKEVF